MRNLQAGNVGNRGDILKHAALVTIARHLRERNPGLLRHFETHTFRLDAPLPDPSSWRQLRDQVAPGPAFSAWKAVEDPWISTGRYRCSAGLAADVLGEPLRLVLAEAHPETRALLRDALEEQRIAYDALVDDAGALANLPAPGEPSPLLLHVDPFDHPREYWSVIETLLSRWRRPHQDAVVLAFAWDRSGPITWPPPPGELVPVGHLDAFPYGLSAWATPALAGILSADLAELGWKIATSDHQAPVA